MSKLFILLIALVAVTLPPSASAHELVKDQIGDAGAIFHVNPDDDITAGERATLFFDITGKAIDPKSGAHFTITDEQGVTSELSPQITGWTVSADYVFQRTGPYEIRLTIIDGGKTTHIFAQSQSVSGAAPKTAPMWAKIGVAVTVFGAGFIGFVAFTRRRAIRTYSTM